MLEVEIDKYKTCFAKIDLRHRALRALGWDSDNQDSNGLLKRVYDSFRAESPDAPPGEILRDAKRTLAFWLSQNTGAGASYAGFEGDLKRYIAGWANDRHSWFGKSEFESWLMALRDIAARGVTDCRPEEVQEKIRALSTD